MNRERFEWIMSGLNQYKLTQDEALFLKTALEDFDNNRALTERQEVTLESFYKEKSRLKPNKNSDYFSFAETIPQKSKVQRLRAQDVLIES